ncbi:ADP-ribosylation factor-like protein 13B [Hyperolius riggenbachi]|uniref:ADP-ribosylation factor-like protein 13B n=1 Tax=Hyperolius riggenbachi TaxID=752182 RepID=UPI0035A34398
MDEVNWSAGTYFKHWKMFHLLSHCCQWVQKRQQPVRSVAILFMGLENSGKSSVIRVIKRVYPSQKCSSYDPLRTELRLDHINLILLEMSSALKSRVQRRLFYTQANAFVFLVDASDEGRLREVASILINLLKDPGVPGKPLLILANKQDRACALLPSEIIERLSLEHLVNESKTLCRIEPCSASTDFCSHRDWTILKGLQWILKSMTPSYSTLSDNPLHVVKEQKENIHLRSSVKPQHISELTNWKVADEEIADIVDYRTFSNNREKVLKPIQTILTQTNYNLQKANRRQRKKVNVKETCPQPLKTIERESHKPKVEPEAFPPGEFPHHHHFVQRIVVPETREKKATEEGFKKRKKKKKQQIKSVNDGQCAGDMGNTFDLYRRAMHALKLKHKHSRERSDP